MADGPVVPRKRLIPAEERGPAVGDSSTIKGGRGGLIKPPIHLQDLRERIYLKAKAKVIGRITLEAKPTGKRSEGNPHAAFEAAGAGDRAG